MLESTKQLSQIIDLANEHLSSNVRSYEDNEAILTEGEVGTSAYIILSGCVSIYSDNTHLACRRSGEIIGEQSLFIQDNERTASAKALGHVRLLEFVQEDIENLTDSQQSLFWSWYSRSLSQKLAQATLGRIDIDGLRARDDALLKKFVASSGISAARTSLLDGGNTFHKQTRAIIWFSDLVGFSSATKGKEPSYVAEIIASLIGKQISFIEQSGGEIDKLIGDGLMAFWLLPDDGDVSLIVEKAVRAALAANSQVMENEWGLGIRIGMHIGNVSVGTFGTEDRFSYTILGEAVNTASRYEQAKKGNDEQELGNVRISPELFNEISEDSDEKNAFSLNLCAFSVKTHQFQAHVLRGNV